MSGILGGRFFAIGIPRPVLWREALKPALRGCLLSSSGAGGSTSAKIALYFLILSTRSAGNSLCLIGPVSMLSSIKKGD